MKNELHSKSGSAGRSSYARSIIALLLILHCFFYSFSQDSRNSFSRSGDDLEYNWNCPDQYGNPHQLTMGWQWHGYDSYQQDYRRLNHGWQSNPYNKFALSDPYYRLTYLVAQRLQEIANEADLPVVYVITSFVQSLKYNIVNDRYCRYTIETLIDGQGMCAEKSMLMAALLNRCGYRTALLEFDDQNHMAVGVAERYDGPSFSGSYYNYYGINYYYVESTYPWEIGVVPGGKYTTAKVLVTP